VVYVAYVAPSSSSIPLSPLKFTLEDNPQGYSASLMQGGEKEKDRVHPMKNPRMIVASILALALVALAALGAITMSSSDTPQTSASSAAAGSLPTVSANAGEVPTVTAPTGTPPAELTTKDIIVGTGAEVLPTSTLTVHYYLMTWSDGKVIESSWVGQPATFALAQVVEGWQKGLPGAKVGGRRLLVLPPEMGYGAAGAGPIGPNETLIFVVDILGVS
jgi:peptidylprolyl isomerase